MDNDATRQKLRVYAIDLDGTLTTGDPAWTPEDVPLCKPNTAVIERVNKLYETNFIVIYTARRDHLIPASLDWLRRNGVRFHAFSNNKMSADVYVDDKSIRPDEL